MTMGLPQSRFKGHPHDIGTEVADSTRKASGIAYSPARAHVGGAALRVPPLTVAHRLPLQGATRRGSYGQEDQRPWGLPEMTMTQRM